MDINYNFIQNLIGLQGINVVYSHVNNGIFEVFATSSFDFAVCLHCGRITYSVHDIRCQPYKHLPIWGMVTVIMLEKKRYVCECDPDHPFDESFDFIRKYQRSTIPYEKRVFELTHKNTIKNVSNIEGISESTCQRIYNYYARKHFETVDPKPLKFLGIDDIATRKGHNYDTVIYNQETGKVVTPLPGRKKKM